ncbi:hypothetical protein Aconfl_06680 [Algoriphagus confluentis]|uniref:Uncharacterized protein n=1 Tax=Algoriphagus confluentis TaxID=1697556 RepID=A0ABQ6PJ84_9BACT|nr:hypothetical protein Aconfl_06680 [Algoriphagus confluentis]
MFVLSFVENAQWQFLRLLLTLRKLKTCTKMDNLLIIVNLGQAALSTFSVLTILYATYRLLADFLSV